MNLTITNQTCEDIIFNGHYLEKLYYNEHLVWEKQHAPVNPYASQYFTIESLEDNNSVTLARMGNAPTINAYYSLDNGTTWTQHATSTEKTWVLNTGDKLLIKATANAWATSTSNYNYFKSTKEFDVYGNVMSLLYGDNFVNQVVLNNIGYNLACLFYAQGVDSTHKLKNASNLVLPATTLAQYCYLSMFRGCTSLTTAPKLPATTLAQYCYQTMFRDCKSLTTAPALPATTLANGCYQYMFQNCTVLETIPAFTVSNVGYASCSWMFAWCIRLQNASTIHLDATVLAESCYECMFYDCISLTSAPILPAITLADSSYEYMFFGCESLQKIVCLAKNITSTSCLDWVQGVALSGTFYKNSTMSSWPTGVNGIPTGWTVQNYS